MLHGYAPIGYVVAARGSAMRVRLRTARAVTALLRHRRHRLVVATVATPLDEMATGRFRLRMLTRDATHVYATLVSDALVTLAPEALVGAPVYRRLRHCASV